MRTVASLCRELTTDPRHDGELLAAFTSGSGETAFTELVRRHGPLVWGTCRRLLPDPADAEDAFQAAFLVLVRRSGELTRSPCVGPWLHRVTVWTARNVRRKNARRLARQTALPDRDHIPDPAPAPDPELKADLDAALLALPARYRDPIVLCHLLGFTRREAAERLGCPEGTLSGWLNRGLAKLRDRLRGLDTTKALAGGAVAVPAALCASTARAAVATSVAAASVPPAVSLLVEGVLHMFWVKKATAAAVALCAVFAMGVGIGLGTRTEYSGAIAQEKGSEKAPAGEKPKQPSEQPAREAMIAELEDAIREMEKKRELQSTFLKLVRTQTEAYLDLERKKNPDMKTKPEDTAVFIKAQKEVEVTTAELKVLTEKLAKLKAVPKPEPLRPGVAAEIADLQKQIELHRLKQELTQIKARQAELRIAEFKRAKADAKDVAAAESALAESQKAIAAAATELLILEAKLAKLKGDAKQEPWYIDLCVGGKKVGIPFEVKEQEPNGGPFGSVKIDTAEMLARHMVRVKKDPLSPPVLRLVIWEDAPNERIKAAFRACQAAGYKDAIVSGKVPTNDPDITFKIPKNDPGGVRDGWFEADEVLVKFDELLKPAKK